MATDHPRPPFPYQARQWAEEGAIVECFSGRDPSDVVHEGRIIGYTEAPTVRVQKDDGQIISWVLGITRKKVDGNDPGLVVDADLWEQSARSLHALQCDDLSDCPDSENHWRAWAELAEAALRPVAPALAELHTRLDHLARCATRDRADMMEAKGLLAERDVLCSHSGHVHLTCDPEADAAYVYLADPIQPGDAVAQVVVSDDRVRSNIVLDFDKDGHLLGVEVLGARDRLRPATLKRTGK